MDIKDLIITSLETITAFDVASAGGAYRWTLDELQDATIQNTQDTNDITGKGGRLLATLKRNKGVTVSGTNGVISGGLLETQVGSKTTNKVTKVAWTDYLTVTSNAATTSYVAVGTTGAEITGLFVRNADGTLGTELEQAATTSTGKFAYDPTTKALTFTDLTDSTTTSVEIVVLYQRNIQADVLENISDKYSEKLALYIDALAEDRCSNVYRVQFYIPKADFSGEFSLEFGDNQTTHGFEARSLASACVSSGVLWTYTIFGDNAADAAEENEEDGE